MSPKTGQRFLLAGPGCGSSLPFVPHDRSVRARSCALCPVGDPSPVPEGDTTELGSADEPAARAGAAGVRRRWRAGDVHGAPRASELLAAPRRTGTSSEAE